MVRLSETLQAEGKKAKLGDTPLILTPPGTIRPGDLENLQVSPSANTCPPNGFSFSALATHPQPAEAIHVPATTNLETRLGCRPSRATLA